MIESFSQFIALVWIRQLRRLSRIVAVADGVVPHIGGWKFAAKNGDAQLLYGDAPLHADTTKPVERLIFVNCPQLHEFEHGLENDSA
jgi:hypothetical protein